MPTNLETVLADAIDHTRVKHVQATIVPSPPHATAYPGDHLFINCYYSPTAVVPDAARCLAVARADVVRFLRCLSASGNLRSVVSVCVTFLVSSISDGTETSLQRLYRYSVLSSAIASELKTIDAVSLLSNGCYLQDSEIGEIRDLIANEPHRETDLSKTLWTEHA